jgi:hypothetical protein
MADDEPYAVITRESGGWWLRWSVTIRHGIGQWGPDGGSWYCWSRRGAEREARKMLRRYLKLKAPKLETHIGVSDLDGNHG